MYFFCVAVICNYLMHFSDKIFFCNFSCQFCFECFSFCISALCYFFHRIWIWVYLALVENVGEHEYVLLPVLASLGLPMVKI